jgi:broad specificity phosphatase PhoE
MIILIRHAQSEGNKDRDIHQFIPDHRVRLTPHGVTQVRFTPQPAVVCTDQAL